MKWKSASKVLVVSMLMLGSSPCLASTWYYKLGLGATLPHYAGDDTIPNNSGFPSPFNRDIYSTKHSTHANVSAEIGKRFSAADYHLRDMLFGVQAQYISHESIGKNVTLYSSPTFLNYTYKLDVAANVLAANAQFDLLEWNKLIPFVTVGAGIIQLILSDYNESAVTGVTPRTSPDFRRYTDFHLTYQVGGGVGYQCNRDTMVSLNYLYQFLGNIQTEKGTGTWSGDSLNFGTAYAHTISLVVTRSLADW